MFETKFIRMHFQSYFDFDRVIDILINYVTTVSTGNSPPFFQFKKMRIFANFANDQISVRITANTCE